MNWLVLIFFISLGAMATMLKRKIVLLGNGHVNAKEKELELPYVVEVKNIFLKKTRQFGYVGVVTIIRLYFKSFNFLKAKYAVLKNKVNSLGKTELKNGNGQKELNGFLKVVSDYKEKIKKIKHRIKEEEENK